LQGYYEELFAVADNAKSGQVDGRAAVEFLSRSKLPVETLKNIWIMADSNPKTNFLDKNKFFVAVRLIQMFQNGAKAQSSDLTVAGDVVMRCPHFDGVTGVSAKPFDKAPPSLTPVPSQQLEPPNILPPNPSNQDQPHQQSQVIHRHSPPVQQETGPGNLPLTPQIPPDMALAAQDPYVMTAVEQGRYESLFPKYENNGFVYGKEAVELFSKSGVQTEILRDIWNMVDEPVDNRLSKLEFAMAMHLIVCISKKNLPAPTILPPSLKRLQLDANNVKDNVAPTETEIPPVPTPQTPPRPDISNKGSFGSMSAGVNTMNISDAFENMNPVDNNNSLNNQENQYGTNPSYPVPSNPAAVPPSPTQPREVLSDDDKVSTPAKLEQSPLPSNNSMPVIPQITSNEMPLTISTQIPISSNDDRSELEKVRRILQKMQAENVSLKAQLDQYSSEEKGVKEDIATTIEEINALSEELSVLRNEVERAKTSLLESTSELKVNVEKKKNLTDLISSSEASKATFESATQNIRNNQPNSNQPYVTTSPNINNLEADFFGFDSLPQTSNPAPAQVATSRQDLETDGYVDVSGYYKQQDQTHEYMAPSLSYETTKQQAVPMGGSTPIYSHSQSQNSLSSAEIKLIEDEISKLENQLLSTDDHTQALTLQLEDLRSESEKADKLYQDKRATATSSKKKIGFKGRKSKSTEKEIETNLEDAINMRNKVLSCEEEISKSQAVSIQLNRKLEILKQQLGNEMSKARSSDKLNQEFISELAQNTPPANFGDVNYTSNLYPAAPLPNSNDVPPEPHLMGFGGFPGSTGPTEGISQVTHQTPDSTPFVSSSSLTPTQDDPPSTSTSKTDLEGSTNDVLVAPSSSNSIIGMSTKPSSDDILKSMDTDVAQDDKMLPSTESNNDIPVTLPHANLLMEDSNIIRENASSQDNLEFEKDLEGTIDKEVFNTDNGKQIGGHEYSQFNQVSDTVTSQNDTTSVEAGIENSMGKMNMQPLYNTNSIGGIPSPDNTPSKENLINPFF